MSFRVSYRDALGVNRLVAVVDSDKDALALRRGLAAEVPRAGARLSTTADPMLELSMQIVQPPYFLDNPAGLPVVYLGGAVDTVADWQAHAVATLRPAHVAIANPRRERLARTTSEVAADAKWRHRHLLMADVAVFWFESDDRDPLPLLELGMSCCSATELAIGTAPLWPRRAELAALLRHHDAAVVLHERLEATLTHAVDLVEDRDVHRLSHMLSLPGAAEGMLSFALIRLASDRTSDERISDVLAAAAHAASRSNEQLLLTRLYVAVDDLRLDDTDPLAWAELDGIADTLRQRH